MIDDVRLLQQPSEAASEETEHAVRFVDGAIEIWMPLARMPSRPKRPRVVRSALSAVEDNARRRALGIEPGP